MRKQKSERHAVRVVENDCDEGVAFFVVVDDVVGHRRISGDR